MRYLTQSFSLGLPGGVLASVLKAEPGPGPDRYNQVRSLHCTVMSLGHLGHAFYELWIN